MKTTLSESPAEMLERIRLRLKTEGAEVATEALISVAKDPKAPAPARATSGVAILRAAGLLDSKSGGGADKPAAEMTPEELSETLSRLKRELAARQTGEHIDVDDNGPDGEGGIFG